MELKGTFFERMKDTVEVGTCQCGQPSVMPRSKVVEGKDYSDLECPLCTVQNQESRDALKVKLNDQRAQDQAQAVVNESNIKKKHQEPVVDYKKNAGGDNG